MLVTYNEEFNMLNLTAKKEEEQVLGRAVRLISRNRLDDYSVLLNKEIGMLDKLNLVKEDLGVYDAAEHGDYINLAILDFNHRELKEFKTMFDVKEG